MWANRTGGCSFICSFLALRERFTNRLKNFFFFFFRSSTDFKCVWEKTLKVVASDFFSSLSLKLCALAFSSRVGR